MIITPPVKPGEEVTIVGHAFGAPLVVKGNTWLPITQLVTWGMMTWLAGKRCPQRSWAERMGVGALTMPVVLGSEWCHNLAHAAAAQLVDKPMDALRITWGMPLIVYYDIEDPDVTPRQHIIRALGGPIFNALLLTASHLLRRRTGPDSVGRDIADAAVVTNVFLLSIALLPLPYIDGGPILKWSLVERGRTPAEADKAVRNVDGVMGVCLGIAGAAAFKKRRWLLGGFLAALAAQAISFALGWIKEK